MEKEAKKDDIKFTIPIGPIPKYDDTIERIKLLAIQSLNIPKEMAQPTDCNYSSAKMDSK